MATRLYLVNETPAFAPNFLRGAWNTAHPSGATQLCSLERTKFGGVITSRSVSEQSFPNPNRVSVLDAVSQPLIAQAIGGQVNVVIGVRSSSPTTQYNWFLHIYVTVGDTQAIRGTLLNSYADTDPSFWNTTAQGKALIIDIPLTGVTSQNGDRIVVEFGYIATGAKNPAAFGTMYYGAPFESTDLTVGDTVVIADAGYIQFTQNLGFQLITGVQNYVGHVVTQVVTPGASAPSWLSHVIVQSAFIPPPIASSIGHGVIQVVPAIPAPLGDLSGLYYLNPSKSFHHDSYYKDTELRILDPTIKTALLGE